MQVDYQDGNIRLRDILIEHQNETGFLPPLFIILNGDNVRAEIFLSSFDTVNEMKALKLIHAIEELVKLADKEFYYRKNNLQLRFSSEDSIFVIGTSEHGMGYLSVSYGFEIDFKFYMEKDGTLLLGEGSMPELLGYTGLEQALNLIDNSGDILLEF
ncbi:MAG: hypothetical protein ACHQ6U_05820 [Thermodesulfobacteriota bacterium]